MDTRDREAGPGFMDELAEALGLRDEWEAGLVRAEHILFEVGRLRREAGEEGVRPTARPFHFRSAKSVQLVVPQVRNEDDPPPRSASLWFIAPAETREVSSQLRDGPSHQELIEYPEESFSFWMDEDEIREVHRKLEGLIDRW
jgi:hypothetical protein